ncbi:major facilitator superfamily domain-containing protein [Irpex lacteus]|nr:major facilitator superfamily domain-containing protein [Irpex lacteus]
MSTLPVTSRELSPAPTLVPDQPVDQKCSKSRRYFLLAIFCSAQFLDAVNNTALFSTIPAIAESLDMTPDESTWIISAFSLMFSSFLLISGRISDVYNAKHTFVGGLIGLASMCLIAGFIRQKIVLIILRALAGIAGAMTIPSALALLADAFPEPKEQGVAIAAFGASGGMGIVFGLLVGAIFVQLATWPWVFYFMAIGVFSTAVAAFVFVPLPRNKEKLGRPGVAKWKYLDLGGIAILTSALILLIFAVTEGGSSTGWGSATVIAPLIISVFMIAAFLFFETRLPEEFAAIPPRIWFVPNFAVLFAASFLPFLWWTSVFTGYTSLWQQVYQWSPISVALRMIPNGVVSLSVSFTSGWARVVSPKWIILGGQALAIVATILLALADSPHKYYSHVLPAFILGSTGVMLTYTHANIAIFRTTPASLAGTVGAVFNGALQLGAAIGISAVSSIQNSIEAKLPHMLVPGPSGGRPVSVTTSYQGRADAFWFILAVVGSQFLGMLVFYRVEAEHMIAPSDVEQAVDCKPECMQLAECTISDKTRQDEKTEVQVEMCPRPSLVEELSEEPKQPS